MSADFRPMSCTMRLRDEGKPAPRSCCVVCGDGGLRGCPRASAAGVEIVRHKLDEPRRVTTEEAEGLFRERVIEL